MIAPPAGWTLEHTGGNCTAWTRPTRDGSLAWYLTCDLDALAPDDPNEPCALNLMSPEHGDPIIGTVCATLPEALALADRLTAGGEGVTLNHGRPEPAPGFACDECGDVLTDDERARGIFCDECRADGAR